MSYNLRSTPARSGNSVRATPSSSNSVRVAPSRSNSSSHAPPTQSTHGPERTNAPVVSPTMTFTEDLAQALADPAIIKAMGMIIENKNAELLANFDGRLEDLEQKVKARDDRIVALEHELQHLKVQSTTVDDGIDELEQYSRLNSVRIQHPNWVENPQEDCVSLVIDYARSNNVELTPRDFDACHRVGRKEVNRVRPILAKFVRRDNAINILKTRATQRRMKSKIYVNEDLTSARATAAQEARALVKNTKIAKSYVFSGKIVIETNDGQTLRITNVQQLLKYGQ